MCHIIITNKSKDNESKPVEYGDISLQCKKNCEGWEALESKISESKNENRFYSF